MDRVGSKRRHIAILVALSLFVTIGVLEVVLRITHLFGARVSWSQPDEHLGWRHAPGASYWTDKESPYPISGVINRHGWRDSEWSEVKTPGTTRIAILGDSYVEAFQVEMDSTFSSITERVLRDAGHRTEILSFGRSGFSQSEELIVLEREVLDLDPDLVAVIFYPPNDIRDISPATAVGRLRPFHRMVDGDLQVDYSFRRTWGYRVRSAINNLKRSSILVSFLAERYNAATLWSRGGEPVEAEETSRSLPGFLSLATRSPDPAYVENYVLCRTLLARMSELCSIRRIDFLIVGIPVIYSTSQLREIQEIDRSFDPGFFNTSLETFADSIGASYLPLGPHFMAGGGNTASSRGHWNRNGHRLVAGALADRLEEFLAEIGP